MSPPTPLILRVAVPVPLFSTFDYHAPDHSATLPETPVGCRVRVPFRQRHLVGLVVATPAESEVPTSRLRSALEWLDAEPLLPVNLIRLLLWSAAYYKQPPGEFLALSLPPALRSGHALPSAGTAYRLTPPGITADLQALQRAPGQRALLQALRARHPQPVSRAELAPLTQSPAPLRALLRRGWAEGTALPIASTWGNFQPAASGPELTTEQSEALATWKQYAPAGFSCTLIEGVTGSGKTELYLRMIDQTVQSGQQALVLSPEIGLLPQLQRRLQTRFPHAPISVLHSERAAGLRLADWNRARTGNAAVVIGTRSAVLTPLPRLGLIVVDEEQDPAYKQQEGTLYSARDLAVRRAQTEGCPVVLGTATPAAETLANARSGRYIHLTLSRRAGGAKLPEVRLIDLRGRPLEDGFSPPALALIEDHLRAEGQVLVFHNRRGFAPSVVCHSCGWNAECGRCDLRLVLHQPEAQLRCHHCNARAPMPIVCPACNSPDLVTQGIGTQRCANALEARFPEIPVVRIDHDTTRKRGSREAQYARIHEGRPAVLIGTQMLAKGHHFPEVTLVVVLDADQGLLSADFRGLERTAQLLVQVMGRAGRGTKPGTVAIQTHQPNHPVWQHLTKGDYRGCMDAELAQRKANGLPPATHMALIRADAPKQGTAEAFLRALHPPQPNTGLEWLGPTPAPVERRVGRFHAQLLLISPDRGLLHRTLDHCLHQLQSQPRGRDLHWVIDVDPCELF